MSETNDTFSSSSVLYENLNLSNSIVKKTSRNSSTTESVSDNLIQFPNNKLGEESNNIVNNRIQIDKASNTVVSEVGKHYKELSGYLQKAVDITKILNTNSNSNSNYNPYSDGPSEESIQLKEAEDKMLKVQAKFNIYKYYSFVWMFSVFLAGVFVVLGVAGVLAPFPSGTGVAAAIIGMIGAFIDWKDREKKYDT